MSAPQISRVDLSIARGALAAVSVTTDRGQLVVIGPCSAGPINTPTPFTNKDDLVDAHVDGPAVEAAAYALAYEVNRLLFVRTDTDGESPGAYGSIDDDDMTGTAVVQADAVVLPHDDYEDVVRFTAGGTVGSAGILYQTSDDDGRKFGGTQALGTATSITLPRGGGKFNLLPPEAVLVTLVAELRTDFLAHENNTAGGVHGMADPNTYTITVPTNYATAITALGQLITSAANHVELATVHGIADATAVAALAALTAPTTAHEAVDRANSLRTILNAHYNNIAGGVHGAADAGNNTTAANASHGTINTGDKFAVVTTAPRWTSDALVAAIESVRDSNLSSGTLEVLGPFATAGEVEAFHAAVFEMRDKIKFRRAQGHIRARNAGETAAAYATYAESIVENLDCDTVSLTTSVYTPSAINVGAVHVRPFCFATAPRTAKLREDISADSRTQFRNLVCQIRDTAGQVLPRAVDDFNQELFTPLRLIASRTWPDKGALVYVGQGVTLGANDTDTQYLRVAQVLDAAAEAAYPHMADRLGEGLTPAPDNTLDENERKRIEERISKILFNAFVKTGKAVGARISIPTGQVVVGLPPITLTFKVLVRVKTYAGIIEAEVAVDATPQAA